MPIGFLICAAVCFLILMMVVIMVFTRFRPGLYRMYKFVCNIAVGFLYDVSRIVHRNFIGSPSDARRMSTGLRTAVVQHVVSRMSNAGLPHRIAKIS